MTADGRKPIRSLAGKTPTLLVPTFQGSLWRQAEVRYFGEQSLYNITLARSGREKIVRATEEHRWFQEARRRHRQIERLTRDLVPGMRLASIVAKTPSSLAVAPLGVAHGFVFGDGTLTGSGAQALFCPPKDNALLPYFPAVCKVKVYGGVSRISNLPRAFKGPPDLNEHPSYLLGWLAGYFAADGCIDRKGSLALASADADNMRTVRDVADLLGIRTYPVRWYARKGYGGISSIGYVSFVRDDLPLEFFILPHHRKRAEKVGECAHVQDSWIVKSITGPHAPADVYCAVVPRWHAFGLADNLLTGNCHAGCKFDSILFSLGLDATVLFEPDRKERPADTFDRDIEATYDYTDLAGKLLYQVVRMKGKEFRQRRPDPKGGWAWTIKGIDRVPYKLPLLDDAVKRGLVAWIVEGERDADSLNNLGRHGEAGFVATTNSGGAGKWVPAFAHYLGGARVVIVQDKDDPGRKHARQVAESLKGLAKTVRIVQAKEGKDATDHLQAGYGLDDFIPAEEGETPADPEAAITYRMSDTGNAMRFADQHHNAVRYVHTWKRWLLWTGTHWRQDDTGAVQGLVQETLEAMWAEARALNEDARLRLLRHTLATEAARRRNAVLEIAGSDPRVATTTAGLDLAGWLVNAKNGTIELTDGSIREHRQSDYLTHCLPVDYDPTALCPRWNDFLIQVMDGRQELVDFLRRAVGYSLTGSTREQVFFMLYGTGSNGKSTFLEVLRSLFGPLAQNADFGTFLHREQETVRNDIARMRAARLVTAVETEGDRRFSETILKSLTGGDTVTARQLYSEYFEFKPMFKLWLAANHRPVIRGTDHAIWRRVRLIPFTVTIPDADQDPDLATKLREEMTGILTWAVRGCLEWQAQRLDAPEDVTDAVTQYRDDMDSIGPFLEECCVLGPDYRVQSGDLMHAYQQWAEKNGGPRFSAIGFANIVRDRAPGAQIVKGGGARRWEGIGLLDDHGLFDGREAAGGNS
jgi:putative DNA primase/helicase